MTLTNKNRAAKTLACALACALSLATAAPALALAPAAPTVAACATSSLIGKDAALEAALRRAGVSRRECSYVRVELDEDAARLHYDVKLVVGGVEYECDVDARTGKVYDFEIDHETDGLHDAYDLDD